MNHKNSNQKVILILGAYGMVGSALRTLLPDALAWGSQDIDATNASFLREKITAAKPDVVINCIAYNNVDGAETDRAGAFSLNAEIPKNLSGICNDLDALFVHFSTGYVFDGSKSEFSENDSPAPLNIYGKSKLAGEVAVRERSKAFYIIRTNGIFGPKGPSEHTKKSFVEIMLSVAEKQTVIKAVSNETNSLMYAPDLAKAVIALIGSDAEFGTYHIINSGSATWFDFAREIFTLKGLSVTVEPVPSSEFPRPAKRAEHTVLANTKLTPLRSWQDALKEYLYG